MSRFLFPFPSSLFIISDNAKKKKKSLFMYMQCGYIEKAITFVFVRDYMPLESKPMTLIREKTKTIVCQTSHLVALLKET